MWNVHNQTIQGIDRRLIPSILMFIVAMLVAVAFVMRLLIINSYTSQSVTARISEDADAIR